MDPGPLILTVAPNGAYKTKADHPALPMTPDELAATAAKCLDAGAAMIHLHVRDENGRHTLDPGAYRSAIDAIRGAVGDRLVIQATSESARIYRPEQQIQAIRELRPESVSLALRELIPEEGYEQLACDFFKWLGDNGCIAQYILYSDAEVEWYRALAGRGVIPGSPHWLLFVLGRYTNGQQSRPTDLLSFLTGLPDRPWSICAFGGTEHTCAVAAAALGGHVRVGFENNLYLKGGSTAARNSDLVAQAADAARMLNRALMDADGVRQLFAA